MMPPRIDASASTLCGRTLRSRAIRGGTLPERRDTPDTRTPSSTSLCTDGVCDYELLVFADDPELQGRDATGRQADRHFVLAERLDGLIELHPAVIDLDVRALELLLDVTRRDRAEQLLVLAGLPLELERHAADASREVVGDRALLGNALLDERLLVIEAVLVTDGRRDGEAAGHEVVAPEAGTDRDELAGLAEVGDVLGEDDLHRHDLVSRDRERQQREHARAADRGGNRALLARRRAGDAARNHLAAVRDDRAQHLGDLVIDLLEDIVREQLAARRTATALAAAAIIAIAVEAIVPTCIHTSGHGVSLGSMSAVGTEAGSSLKSSPPNSSSSSPDDMSSPPRDRNRSSSSAAVCAAFSNDASSSALGRAATSMSSSTLTLR